MIDRIHSYRSDSYNFLLQPDLKLVKADFIKNFPDEEKGIEKFFRHVEQLTRTSIEMSNFSRSSDTMGFFEKTWFFTRSFPYIFPLIKHVKYSGNKGVQKGLSRYFKGNAIKDVFSSESDFLSCLFPFAWAKNRDYFATPTGGSVAFVDWLMAENKKLGTDVFLNSEVKKILVENKKVTGIVTQQKSESIEISAKYVVATSDLISVYRHLLPKGSVPEKVIKKLENSVHYKSGFSVSVALDCPAEELGFGEELISLIKNNLHPDQREDSNPDHSKLSIVAPSVRDKTVCKKENGIVIIYMSADIEKYDFWKTKLNSDGKRERGAEYRKFKKEIAERLIKRMDDEVSPNFSKHILFYDTASPFTYERYTANHRGTIMGTRYGKENMKNKVASHYTDIENLLVGGHWSELGGGIPTTSRAAMNTTIIILKKENKKIAKKIAKYFDGIISLDELEEVLPKK